MIRPDGTAGSYTLQARLVRRVYELVDFVETTTRRDLKREQNVPTHPPVRAATNVAIQNVTRNVPDVMLGIIKDEEVLLGCKSESSWLVFLSTPLVCPAKYIKQLGLT